MNTSDEWIDLAEAHAILIEAEGLQSLAERLLIDALIGGHVKARSVRTFVGGSDKSVQMELPVEEIFQDPNARPNFVWTESRVVFGKRFFRKEKGANSIWQPQQEFFRVQIHREQFKALMLPLEDESPSRNQTNSVSQTRKRGVRPIKRDAVERKMAAFSSAELQKMKEEEMVARFGASRDTCRKARDSLLSKIVEDPNTDK